MLTVSLDAFAPLSNRCFFTAFILAPTINKRCKRKRLLYKQDENQNNIEDD